MCNVSEEDSDKVYSFYSHEKLNWMKCFSSIENLRQNLVLPLNKELGEEALVLRKPRIFVRIQCTYSGCPFRYYYAKDRELGDIKLRMTKCEFHSLKAHRGYIVQFGSLI